MTVRWAQKSPHLKGTPLRGFVDAGTHPASEFVYLKDAFEFGAHSQLFVGTQNGEPRVFKRVSALPAKTPGGLRHAIAEEKADIAVSLGRKPNELPWHLQGTMPRWAVAEEIAAVRACKSGFASRTAILATPRCGGAEPSKYFYVMPPAPTDLLGCIHALHGQTPAMRRNLALLALRQLVAQLLDMHAVQGKAHRDVRSENILCLVDSSGNTEVLLWDFGLTIAADPRSLLAWARADMQALGKVFAMLLAPDLRSHLTDQDLRQSLNTLNARFADLAPILQGLLHPDPAQRWTAPQLSDYLTNHPPDIAPEADVRNFMPSVHPLKDAIDAKWQIFLLEALKV